MKYLNELENVENLGALAEDNAELTEQRLWFCPPSKVGGVATTIVGPPDSGTWDVDELWWDANRAKWRCTEAGTPGVWQQVDPAVVTANPETAPNNYWVIRPDLEWKQYRYDQATDAWVQISGAGGATDVLGTVLTGFDKGDDSAVGDTDTVLSAFGKLQGQIEQIPAGEPGLVWIDGGWAFGLGVEVNNALTHNGASFRCIQGHNTSTVSDAGEPGVGDDWELYWERLTGDGLAWREWVYGNEYNLNDAVPRNGSSYRCIKSHQTNSDPDGYEPGVGPDWETYWQVIAQGQPATITVNFIIDGGGSVITTGAKGFVELPFALTITGWTLLADVVGDLVV